MIDACLYSDYARQEVASDTFDSQREFVVKLTYYG